MKNQSRREFLHTSIAAAATLAGSSIFLTNVSRVLPDELSLGQMQLGKSGVKVSRLAFGTGTNGWGGSSAQTRLGNRTFLNLAQHAYDSGITFLEAADMYGSHTYLREAMKYIPREKVAILTKIWPSRRISQKAEDVAVTLDRFRKELGVDYIDIVLIHCQTDPEWLERLQGMREQLSEAKAKGIIRAHGVSCHSLSALKKAASSDWVDVLLSRINPAGAHMDDRPNMVMPVLKQAHDSGKGVIGMKIFGAGDLVDEEQREASLQFAWGSKNIDAMTIGFENSEQITDAIKRIKRILAA
jgi:predicted aldo/keto reductase-like oxidoreductase